SGHSGERGGITAPTPTLPRKRGREKTPSPACGEGNPVPSPACATSPSPRGSGGRRGVGIPENAGHHCPTPTLPRKRGREKTSPLTTCPARDLALLPLRE